MSGEDVVSGSWPSNGTNSVSTENPSETGSASGEGLEQIGERVLEFVEEYPDRAGVPLSETDGQKLRRDVTEAERVRHEIDLDHAPGTEIVSQVVKRRAVPWKAAVERFLEVHDSYRDGRLRFGKGRDFVGESGREEFEVALDDSWGGSYADREYAKAKAIQREAERQWGGDYTTVMLTLTASAVPGCYRLPPVDHLRSILDTWSDYTYHSLRNTMRSLGFDRDEWMFWVQGEPHAGGGDNACYGHIHVAVYVDGSVSERDFHSVIDAHVEHCKYAEFSAHDYTANDPADRPISINSDVNNLGSYMAEYAGNYGGELVERPVEYLAWGAIYWVTGSQRARRSQTANEAIRADACRQRYEHPDAGQRHDHGERLRHSDGRGPEIECAGCGSAWGVPQGETITAARSGGSAESGGADEEGSDPVADLRSRWPSAQSAATMTGGGEVAGFEDPPEWQAEAVIFGEGEGAEEHPVGGGGVDMVELYLPEEGGRGLWNRPEGAKFRCSVCGFATYSADVMKRHSVGHDPPPEETVEHEVPPR